MPKPKYKKGERYVFSHDMAYAEIIEVTEHIERIGKNKKHQYFYKFETDKGMTFSQSEAQVTRNIDICHKIYNNENSN